MNGYNTSNMTAVNDVNRASITGDSYLNLNLGIKRTDPETKHVVSSTYGVLKGSYLETPGYYEGLNSNIDMAIAESTMNSNNSFEANGRIFHAYTGVENLRSYNDAGYPQGGCWSLHLIG